MAAGRAPLPQSTVDLVLSLLDAGHSQRQVVTLALQQGVSVSRTSVRNIANPRRRTHSNALSRLRPGEQEAPPNTRCPTCRGLLTIIPCRLCTPRAYFAEFKDRIAASQAKAAEHGQQGIRRAR